MKVVKKRCKSAVWTCICIFFGNAIIAFAIAAFVMPHGLIMGGATGLSILINRVLRSDIAVVVLSLNLLALLLGYVVLGKKFLITTVGSSLLYPALLGLAQRIPGITALTDDLLLASLLAGGLIGIAVGMVMRVGGSTGGTDESAQHAGRHSQEVSLGCDYDSAHSPGRELCRHAHLSQK